LLVNLCWRLTGLPYRTRGVRVKVLTLEQILDRLTTFWPLREAAGPLNSPENARRAH
jgi:hypothetical protein